MAKCRDCGSEKVGWDKTKDGRFYLRDFGQPHGHTCTAGNGQQPRKAQPKEPDFSSDITGAEQDSLAAAIAAAEETP